MNDFIRKYSVERMLLVGFVIRLILVFYAAVHDYFIGHIKFTDVDYHVFNNGSKALFAGKSPYDDEEYRYSPIVALIFLPNVLNPYIGKLMIIIADVLCGYLQYTINIQQGTQRLYSKAFLLLWLFNPFTISISARGSFEPMLVLLILTFLYSLVNNLNTFGGMMYGLAIHLKLYPIIYSGALYLYLIKRRPYMITQSKLTYWLKTLSPNSSQLQQVQQVQVQQQQQPQSNRLAIKKQAVEPSTFVLSEQSLLEPLLTTLQRNVTKHNLSHTLHRTFGSVVAQIIQ